MSPGPEMRIGDAERDSAITALGEHYAAGRLTKAEYDERSEVALRARTGSELRALFLDLPPTREQAEASRRTARAARPAARPAVWQVVPLVPLLVALAVLVAVSTGGWWLLLVFGWVFFCRPGRHWRCR